MLSNKYKQSTYDKRYDKSGNFAYPKVKAGEQNGKDAQTRARAARSAPLRTPRSRRSGRFNDGSEWGIHT